MRTLIATILVFATSIGSAEVIQLSDYRSIEKDLESTAVSLTKSTNSSVSRIEIARLRRKFAGILGIFTNPELANLKDVLESAIDSVSTTLTRISVEELNKKIVLSIKHWDSGKLITSANIPIEKLEAEGSVKEEFYNYKLTELENGAYRISVENRNPEKGELIKFALESITPETIEFEDKYLAQEPLFKGRLNRIDHLPTYAEGNVADISTLINYVQLDLQDKKIKSEVALTDFLRGHFAPPKALRCAFAFN